MKHKTKQNKEIDKMIDEIVKKEMRRMKGGNIGDVATDTLQGIQNNFLYKIPGVGSVLKAVGDNAENVVSKIFGIKQNPLNLETYGLSDAEKDAKFFHDFDYLDPKDYPDIAKYDISPFEQHLYSTIKSVPLIDGYKLNQPAIQKALDPEQKIIYNDINSHYWQVAAFVLNRLHNHGV